MLQRNSGHLCDRTPVSEIFELNMLYFVHNVPLTTNRNPRADSALQSENLFPE